MEAKLHIDSNCKSLRCSGSISDIESPVRIGAHLDAVVRRDQRRMGHLENQRLPIGVHVDRRIAGRPAQMGQGGVRDVVHAEHIGRIDMVAGDRQVIVKPFRFECTQGQS